MIVRKSSLWTKKNVQSITCLCDSCMTNKLSGTNLSSKQQNTQTLNAIEVKASPVLSFLLLRQVKFTNKHCKKNREMQSCLFPLQNLNE